MTGYQIVFAIIVALVALAGQPSRVECATNETANETTTSSYTSSTPTMAMDSASEPIVNASAPRTGRVMKILANPSFKRARAPPQTLSRSDRFPLGPPQRMPVVYHRHPSAVARPQMLRRVQNNVPTGPQLSALQHYNYDPVKTARYTPVKTAPPFTSAGKGGIYRPQFAAGHHPNALVQYPLKQYSPNFKASPPFNGNAIVRPVNDQHDQYTEYLQHQQPQQPAPQYHEVKQHPLPQQHQQHYTELQETAQYLNQREQYALPAYATQTQPPYQPARPNYPQTKPYQAALAQPQPDSQPASLQSYSVYEDPDLIERSQFASIIPGQHQPVYSKAHHAPTSEAADREAQSYLQFMNSNDYFLPRREPNYKKLDEDLERRQHKQPQHQPSTHQFHYSKSITDTSGAASLKKPVQVSQLYYQQDPSPSTTIVRGSYQTGNNIFVVNSDGNKAVKHIVPSSLPPQATTPAASYADTRYNGIKSRTPEPLRFEFTERDAVPSTYTNSPLGQLRYKSIGSPSTPSAPTSATTNYSEVKPVSELNDDPEDGEDMQEASSDNYGRVPVRATASTSEPPVAQKDTEEYCERICANVQDDDEEVVCGSDGYMYTSEAQMECYASCLHIDVTIQSKGSCSTR